MGQYTSYWLYQKYEQRGSQEPIPVYPNTYSINGDGTMTPVVRNEDDPQCGYVPPVEPTYRWTNIPITQDYICDECGIAQYRWVNMDASVDYYCEGTTKYYKQKQQVSYDGGQTWQDVTPPVYQKGGVAESQSTDCGYVPPTPTGSKLVATYQGGTTRTVPCNDTPILDRSEIRREDDDYEYSAITSLVIGDCVTSISSGACVALRSLTSVTIPNSVTTIGRDTFSGCVSLPTITLPTGLTTIETQLFDECISLTGLTIPNSVTSIGWWAFRGCSGLTSIDIPNNVTNVGYAAFSGCTSLSSVTFGSSVDRIMDSAFAKCTGLTSLTIPDNVTTIDHYAFNGCSGVTNVSVGSGLTTIPYFFMARNPSLTSVTLSEGTASIDESAFQLCTGLTSVTIPSSVGSIVGQAFYGCSGLTSITCLGATPPSLVGSQIQAFDYTNDCPILVPAESVSYYKIGSWDKYADRIRPIS